MAAIKAAMKPPAINMTHTYKITGMSCNGCVANVEHTLRLLPEVTNVKVSLSNADAVIEMSSYIPASQLQEALTKAGLHYTIEDINHDAILQSVAEVAVKPTLKGNGIFYCPMHCEGTKTYEHPGNCPVCGMDLIEQPAQSGNVENKTYQELITKFKVAVIFTIPVFLISMSEMLPWAPFLFLKVMSQQKWNWVQFVLSIPVVFYATGMFFKRAYHSVVSRNLNMFTLIGVGAGIAFLFSIFALLFPDIFPAQFKTESGTVFVYFEATTVILTLVLLGQLLEARAHSQTSGAIKELMKLAPSEATLVVSGEDRIISIDEIKKGDLLRLKPGEKIPVDGFITEGNSTLDESMITGEPIPVDKHQYDKVIAGTINKTKSFIMRAEKVGAETILSQIIEMVNSAGRSKAPIQKTADTIAKYFVPVVILISLITFFIWIIFGPEPAYVYGFVNAIAVLIIACPCALGLATPMSVVVGVGKGAQFGILIKNAEALEKMNTANILVIDKTGTITEGKPSVEKVVAIESLHQDELLIQMASLNQYSEHPLAEAIMNYSKKKEILTTNINDFETIAGMGVTGTVNGKKIVLGNRKLMEAYKVIIDPSVNIKIENEQKKGRTVSIIAADGKISGYITIIDSIKKSSKDAIQTLLQSGMKVIMLTGDNLHTAKLVADELTLTGFKAECLPEDKLKEIKRLQAEGNIVAMAGDGINDAPALAQADIGIAMGTGTDVAMESAEITLLKGDLLGIVKAKKLSHAVIKNIKQNLFFAFCYNIIGIPVAAGILYPFFGILLSPMIAAAAMSFSSVSVITNSLRLRNTKL